MKVLGISALYHDSAATLVVDGEIVAAAQEERFTRRKHDAALPVNAIGYCLEAGRLTAEQLDAVCYYDNPYLSLDRWLKNYVAEGQGSGKIIERSFPGLFSRKLWIHEAIKAAVGGLGRTGKLLVCEHHISHAASAFYPSPFEHAAILTVDGVGEWATTTIGIGKASEVTILKQLNFPHSLGLLYSALTYFCGFKVNSGEYKLMGLAPYGEPVYADLFKDKLIEVRADGSFHLNTEYFAFPRDSVMTDDFFGGLFEAPRRQPHSPITKREMDLAASIQKVTEEIILRLAGTARAVTGESQLCLSGGVALNCVANGKLAQTKLFERLWIQPAAGDAGGSLGCALYAYYHHFKNTRTVGSRDTMNGSYLGPSFAADDVQSFLDRKGAVYRRAADKSALARDIAKLLADNCAVGLFAGRMEFGPRALGNRSIIANPMTSGMQARLNLKIKFRESFRPFAPTVLAERAGRYFEIDQESPYMLLVAPVREELRKPFDLQALLEQSGADMLPIVNQDRSTIPAVTHVDYSARVQTVAQEDNPFYHAIIAEFERLAGCAVIVNTSFNVRGEPIVGTPEQAYLCFMRTGLDALILEDFILLKSEQPPFADDPDWRAQYELD